MRHFPTSDEQAPAGGVKGKVSSIAGEGDAAPFVDVVAVCNEGKGPRCWMGGTACSEVAEGGDDGPKNTNCDEDSSGSPSHDILIEQTNRI